MGFPKDLDSEALYSRCNPAELTFETTAEVVDGGDVLGQSRAMQSVRFGIELKDQGYNIFALGPNGVGKRFLIQRLLKEDAANRSTPPDLCYINNLADPNKPRLLVLPAGRAAALKRDIEDLITDIGTALPKAFESEDYQSRLNALQEQIRARSATSLNQIRERATRKGLALVHTRVGPALVPAGKDDVLTPEEFGRLDPSEQARLRKDIEELQEELQKVFRQVPAWERELRSKLRELDQHVATSAVVQFINELKDRNADLPSVQTFLADVQNDIASHAQEFLKLQQADSPAQTPGARLTENVWAKRYGINVLVDQGALKGAPVVYEDLPTYENLIGRIEHTAKMGTLTTDFSLIKAGALHKANGGYLILEAHKVLMQPYAWEALKRSLRSGQIRIESMGQVLGVVATASLEPEPVQLDVKVIVTGERHLYYLLSQSDPDFGELFKVAADFDEDFQRTAEHEIAYARLLASLIRERGLRDFNRSAIARVIEHSSRLVSDSGRLSLHLGVISDLLREANYQAGRRGSTFVSKEDVEGAIDGQVFRADRVPERLRSEILRETIQIDTGGEKVGQVNGLSTIQLAAHTFGRPVRITARVRPGKGEVIDIEREVELGGPLHSKGVFILSGFLGARYARDFPLALSATLVFEQSYSGVDGDSASSTELYALLSALAEVPIRQSIAVTGSVNQHGQVQAIGAVNEKIEGFFEICARRGLTGEHGVLIPASNVEHLMLHRDVIEAVRAGRFRIWPVETIDQGIELLTGVPAGELDSTGSYPTASIGAKAQARLREMAERQISFAKFLQREPQD